VTFDLTQLLFLADRDIVYTDISILPSTIMLTTLIFYYRFFNIKLILLLISEQHRHWHRCWRQYWLWI